MCYDHEVIDCFIDAGYSSPSIIICWPLMLATFPLPRHGNLTFTRLVPSFLSTIMPPSLYSPRGVDIAVRRVELVYPPDVKILIEPSARYVQFTNHQVCNP